MRDFPYIRAYASLIEVDNRVLQAMLKKVDQYYDSDIDENKTPFWCENGGAWRYIEDLPATSTIRGMMQDWVAERGGRSEDFIQTRDLFGAVEVEHSDTSGVTWQERLCMEYGWDDPRSIQWAAITDNHHGVSHPDHREFIVLQTEAEGVQIYVIWPNGDTKVVALPQVVA